MAWISWASITGGAIRIRMDQMLSASKRLYEEPALIAVWNSCRKGSHLVLPLAAGRPGGTCGKIIAAATGKVKAVF